MLNCKDCLKFLLLGLFSLMLFSCDESCVEPDEYAITPFVLDANMSKNRLAVTGGYDHENGGQQSDWFDTGIRTNGDKITVYITGSWIFNNGSENLTQDQIDTLPICNICSKDIAISGPQNCICHSSLGQNPGPEKKDDGTYTSCVNASDPATCSCINRGDSYPVKYGVYHQILNSLKKNPANQDRLQLMGQKQSICRLTYGMGAYISLWGVSGGDVPTRAYHLFSTVQSCPVARDSQGRCMRNGKDLTRYVFTSADNKIFVKNDGLSNDLPTTSTSTPGFQYHGKNEVIKLIIYDGFYNDNAGKYKFYFSGGVANSPTSFLLEYIVSTVEDAVIGKKNSAGVREGGVMELMFNSIINNDAFKLIVSASLTLFIMFFGGAYMMGIVEMSRKEISLIILKLSLVLMFTNTESWFWYKTFVVNFFKDGMDDLMAMIMNSTDSVMKDPSNINFLAQSGRAIDGSSATRFSYPDLLIKKLLSPSVAKKLLAVFSSGGFGMFYGVVIFPLAYALILYLVYVLMLIMMIYLITMIKMVFILALGPLFIVLVLFSKTNDMFKSWLSFLGSRALEMALLFLVLSPFLLTIDQMFTEMFYYGVCGVQKGIPPVNLIVLQSVDLNRSFVQWMVMFLKIAGIIFIMQNVIDRISYIAGSLISISGVPNQDTASRVGYGEGGFALASQALGQAMGLAMSGIKKAGSLGLKGAGMAVAGATSVARATGVASAFNAVGKKLPFRGPRTRMRDSIIEGAIKKAKADGEAYGKTGKALDQYVRNQAMKALSERIAKEPTKMAMYGVDGTNIGKVFDRVLIRDGMKNFMQMRAQQLKQQGLIGKDFRNKMREEAKEWARENSYDSGAEKKAGEFLKNARIKSLLRNQTEYSSTEAARIFSTDEERAKYLNHLQDLKYRSEKKWNKAKKNPFTHMVPYLISSAKHKIVGDVKGNPNLARENFDRKAKIEDQGRKGLQRYNPLTYVNFLDKRLRADEFKENAKHHDELLRQRLVDNLEKDYSDLDSGEIDPSMKRADRYKKQKRINHRDVMQTELRKLAIKEAQRELSENIKKYGDEYGKKIYSEDLVGSFTKDDGKTIFEKAVKYDYVQGLKGKDSAEAKIAQAMKLQMENFKQNIDDMSLQEALKAREELASANPQKALFAKKIDPKLMGFVNKVYEQGLEIPLGLADQKTIWDSKSQNSFLRNISNQIKFDIAKTDEKLLEQIEAKAKVYDEDLNRMEKIFDQLTANQQLQNKQPVMVEEISQEAFRARLDDVANAYRQVGSSAQQMVDDIDKWKKENNILFTTDNLLQNDRHIENLLQAYNFDDPASVRAKLSLELQSLRSLDSKFDVYFPSADSAKNLGIDKFDQSSYDLQGQIQDLINRYDQGRINLDGLKNALGEIQRQKDKLTEEYNQAMRLFELEYALKESSKQSADNLTRGTLIADSLVREFDKANDAKRMLEDPQSKDLLEMVKIQPEKFNDAIEQQKNKVDLVESDIKISDAKTNGIDVNNPQQVDNFSKDSEQKMKVIVDSLQVEFGASIDKALIGGSGLDALPKASLPFIGQDPNTGEVQKVQSSETSAIKAQKITNELNLKTAKINLKMLEFKLGSNELSESEVASINADIEDLKKKQYDCESKLAKIEEDLEKNS